LTVTFWPADVVNVKLPEDTLPTVPAAPPGAGPDRALEPAPPEPCGPAPPVKCELPAAAAEDEDEDEDDEAQPAARPVTAHAMPTAIYAFGFMAFILGGA
jgi:hypothetical protein